MGAPRRADWLRPTSSSATQLPGGRPRRRRILRHHGDLVDGRFSEKRVKADREPEFETAARAARRTVHGASGSDVAYQATWTSLSRRRASKFIKKALTGEACADACQGQGDVFLAERAYDVHLLNLNNAGLSISGKERARVSSSLD